MPLPCLGLGTVPQDESPVFSQVLDFEFRVLIQLLLIPDCLLLIAAS